MLWDGDAGAGRWLAGTHRGRSLLPEPSHGVRLSPAAAPSVPGCLNKAASRQVRLPAPHLERHGLINELLRQPLRHGKWVCTEET